MKTLLTSIGILLTFICQGQTLDKNNFIFRGPVEPLIDTYANVKTLELQMTKPEGFENNLHKFNTAVSSSTMEKELYRRTYFYDFKNVKDLEKEVNKLEGDLKVNYELVQFEVLKRKTISKKPAWVIGFESKLSIKDKEGKLIYSRFTPLKVNTYIVDVNITLETLIKRIIYSNFNEQFDGFSNVYLKQPVIGFAAYKLDLPRKDKNLEVEKEIVEKFNLSAEIFDAIEKSNTKDYDRIFQTARPYWETFLNFDKADKTQVNNNFIFAANSNLAASYLLIGDQEKAAKYIQNIKNNDSGKGGFVRLNNFVNSLSGGMSNLEEWDEAIKDAKNQKKLDAQHFKNNIEPNSNLFYKNSELTMEKTSFTGQITTLKGEEFFGTVEILNDNPPHIDQSSSDSGSSMGNLIGSLKTEKNAVRVYIDGQKKPEKLKMDDIKSINTQDGTQFLVDKVGNYQTSDQRYGIFREFKKGDVLSLFIEDYPNSGTILLKKNSETELFEIPTVINRKKALTKYFDACPNIHSKIEAGEYLDKGSSTYLLIYEDYKKLCN